MGVIGVSVFSVGAIFALEPGTKVKSFTDWIFDESNSLDSARSIRRDYQRVKKDRIKKSAEEFKSSICITKMSYYCRELRKSYGEYSDPRLQSQRSKTVRKTTAPLLIYWGGGTVAAVSVISAVLAVERNTRKD